MNPLQRLEAYGQSPWLDYLTRSLIAKGELRTLIGRDGLKGVTSNSSIFEKAIGESDEYAEAIKQFQVRGDHGISAIYEHLAIVERCSGGTNSVNVRLVPNGIEHMGESSPVPVSPISTIVGRRIIQLSARVPLLRFPGGLRVTCPSRYFPRVSQLAGHA
jgi:hypothetical protein